MKQLLLGILFLFSYACIAAPLPAEQVFVFDAKFTDPNNIVLNWRIKPGYFLYKDKINIHLTDQESLALGDIRWPLPVNKTDTLNHSYPVYRDTVNLPLGILGKKPGETIVEVSYQGCSDAGFCYPPQQSFVKLGLDSNFALSTVNQENSNLATKNPRVTTKERAIDSVFSQNQWPMILFTFLGFGLLLSFTPCVLPMVPILSGIIVGHGTKISTRKAFFLSLSYVISMATTYALVGAIVALLGSNLQIIMQSPWAVGFFAVVFVLLALSMFGYYELQLPSTWQQKLNFTSKKQESGHYIGAAIMGVLSTLILSPCVTAPLIGALGYIAQTGNVLLGSLSLFFLGLGMGIPLLLIGTSAGSLLPKAGAWMNTIKIFFGLLLLAVAINLVSRIIADFFTMLLWSALFVFSGLYCGALSNKLPLIRKGVGVMMLSYGLLILLGASLGNSDPRVPLANLASTHFEPKLQLKTRLITRVDEAKKALATAKVKGTPVMIDFYADWCVSCKIIASTILKDPDVLQNLRKFAVLKVDVTDNTADNKALLHYFNVVAPPTFLFFNAAGVELNSARVVGESEPSTFVDSILAVTQ